ncbi:MAG: TIGR02530 family flagellar biosynthesis protein [Candidatus Zixiibacteriota bacterium]
MKINNFNQDVRLLDIARQGNVGQNAAANKKTNSFKEVFNKEIASGSQVNFSKHAEQRLFSRGISLSDDKLRQLSEAFDKAESKGARDTLILDDDAAYIGSVANRTIITAFDRNNLQEGIFTSIDSAVIL